ncbi:flightin isoform X1 [Anopheles arabiensis]|uniref:AGAP007249-PA n=6 Tax=gambiae species complex TaxID=44542 RepID=Q7QJ36_ANOGA|nr:flightin isoform X1 [Anopheles arabiensis]XP_040227681.1 flightin [Anopheles coluzzii]XP_041769372.1 flightin isoform X1 [Anopheles merus]XP_308552.4 flightin [Anopheles gambiae]EAA04317.4 AGAP007249-PA [Anopheles gambiae str. PEST]
MDDGAASTGVIVKNKPGAKPLNIVDDFNRRKMPLYKHWVRPQFLQYNYMYDYRVNYYDDVIDYLDRRSRGVASEIPRPQTWAERVLRTQKTATRDINDAYNYTSISHKKDDKKLMYTLSNQIKSYNCHSKAYTNRKYRKIL